jgi:uncharacterized protein (TIGR03905 family)
MFRYPLRDVCATEVEFSLKDGKVKDISFTGGCPGNLQAIAILAEGCPASELIEKLTGLSCGGKYTSCADQFARALKQASGSSL